MGMYTELNIGVEFVEDIPENVVNILKFMVGDITDEPETTDHPLFETERWRMMLCSDSAYFAGHTDSSLQYDDISRTYNLNVRCNLKNYDDEINQFLSFIRPYLETTGFLGYTRYEEDENPRLIYNDPYAYEPCIVYKFVSY